MKKLISKAKKAIKSFFAWVWMECKDWRTLVLLAFVCVVIGLPVWGGYLLGFIFKWKWAIWVASICWAFWMVPGVPFFTVSISITLAIKKIYEKIQEKKNRAANEEKSSDADDNKD